MAGNCLDPAYACNNNRNGYFACDATWRNAFWLTVQDAEMQKEQLRVAYNRYTMRLFQHIRQHNFQTAFAVAALAAMLNNGMNSATCNVNAFVQTCNGDRSNEPQMVRCMLREYTRHACRGSPHGSASRARHITDVFAGHESTPYQVGIMGCTLSYWLVLALFIFVVWLTFFIRSRSARMSKCSLAHKPGEFGRPPVRHLILDLALCMRNAVNRLACPRLQLHFEQARCCLGGGGAATQRRHPHQHRTGAPQAPPANAPVLQPPVNPSNALSPNVSPTGAPAGNPAATPATNPNPAPAAGTATPAPAQQNAGGAASSWRVMNGITMFTFPPSALHIYARPVSATCIIMYRSSPCAPNCALLVPWFQFSFAIRFPEVSLP